MLKRKFPVLVAVPILLIALFVTLAVTPTSSLFGLPQASAQTPPLSGGITFDPPTGTHDTIVAGTTDGPCDIGESNAYQVFVAGPDRFAPRPGQEDGVTFRGPNMPGFSKTDRNNFNGRLSFQQLAQEEGLSAVPVGVYTIEFRCIDELLLTHYQTYRSTITFTTPTTYTTQTTATPTPTPGTPTPTPSPTPETPTPTPAATPPPGGVTATTTTLSVSPRRAFRGFPVFLHARVKPFAAAGTIQFKDGSTDIGAPVPVFNGFAFLITSTLDQGTHSLTAEFTPANPAAFGPSTSSPPMPLKVRPLFSTPVLIFIQAILEGFFRF